MGLMIYRLSLLFTATHSSPALLRSLLSMIILLRLLLLLLLRFLFWHFYSLLLLLATCLNNCWRNSCCFRLRNLCRGRLLLRGRQFRNRSKWCRFRYVNGNLGYNGTFASYNYICRFFFGTCRRCRFMNNLGSCSSRLADPRSYCRFWLFPPIQPIANLCKRFLANYRPHWWMICVPSCSWP